MSTEENKAIMRRMIEELWNQGNMDVADELFAPDHTSPSAPDLPPGSEGVKIITTMFRNAMPDYHMTIDFMVAEGDQVAARFTQSGTHTGGDLMGIAPTDKKATWTEIGILRIKDGKIVESWYEVDMMSLMQQLGVIPPIGEG
ncbi:MAG: ester cyclase [Candidatus Bipolaricaulia bacterium]